ncbi:TonB-dependent receptor, partial [Acinetobacter baumannii]
QSYLGGGSPVFGGAGIAVGAPTTALNGHSVFTKFTPRVSLSFRPNPNHNLDASYSQGFKGGGFDPRGAGSNAPDLNGDGQISQAEVSQFLSFK